MGVFERAPETGRLHFHGLLYIPDGEIIGEINERTDYSTAKHTMQTTHENTFFEETFGRNDFCEVTEMELKKGQRINYILKYIEKTGERIVYSRGIPSEVYAKLGNDDIITEFTDFVTKYVLFDSVIDWERDVLRHRHYKQVSLTDYICNPPSVA